MQNFFDFTGKVVLVTGASSGIGRATAEFFGRCGASVAISYLKNKTGADETVDAISGNGVASFVSNSNGAAVGTATVAAMAVQADVTQNAEISRMIREVESQLG